MPTPTAATAASAGCHVNAMTAHDMRVYLGQLLAERIDATEAGLAENAVYMSELEQDLVAAHEAFVGLVVTEIATLRGQLSGPQLG